MIAALSPIATEGGLLLLLAVIAIVGIWIGRKSS